MPLLVAATPRSDIIEEVVRPSSSSATPPPSDDGGSVESDKIWSKFKGFKPKPRTTFNREFHRLAVHMRWNPEERRQHRVELFYADFTAHVGSNVYDLELWQDLCSLCTIDPVPDSIPGCMEVSRS